MRIRPFLTCAAAAALLAAVAPAPAHADWDRSDGSSHDRWKDLRLEGDVGALIGAMGIGPISGFAGGLYAEGGVRRDRLALYGEYELLSVGQSPTGYNDNRDPVRGYMQRVGADVRYSFARFGGGHVPVRGDIWLSVGAGGEVIQWYDGGRLHRRDLSLGFGSQATFRIGHEHPHYLGFHYAVKAFIAHAPGQKNEDPTCAGPCDEPTPPVPYDTGIFFDFGIVFGK